MTALDASQIRRTLLQRSAPYLDRNRGVFANRLDQYLS